MCSPKVGPTAGIKYNQGFLHEQKPLAGFVTRGVAVHARFQGDINLRDSVASTP